MSRPGSDSIPDAPRQPPAGSDARNAARPWDDDARTPFIRIEDLSRHFNGFSAVNHVDLEIYQGELFTILGASGCGKTTLLRMLAGFETPSSGRVVIDGVDMTRLPPYERPVNMMFQSYAVFPHMTVEQNVAYGLRKEGVAAPEIRERATAMLDLVQLSDLAGRRPHQLSGGQRQRVALARALVKRPKVLLLDEPLAALDRKLREHTQFELMNIQDRLGVTFIVVTHDQEEAMTLASRIAVMDRGRFIQIGTPKEIYEFPKNRFVADFFGTINLFPGKASQVSGDSTVVHCSETGTALAASSREDVRAGDPVWIAVRPEKIAMTRERPESGSLTVLKGVVWDLAYYGNRSLYRVKTESGKIVQVSAQNRIRTAHGTVEWNDEVYLSWDRQSCVMLTE